MFNTWFIQVSTEHETTINIYTIPDLYYTFVVGYACAF